jgi:predicted nucleic acid-binding protein
VIVVDASAVVAVLVDTDVSSELLQTFAEEALQAPALVDFEVASAIRGHVLGNLLSPARSELALSDFASLTIDRQYMTALLPDMVRLRDNFTAYDAAYVVLALALDAPLVTTDAKLLEARRLGARVDVLAAGQAGGA